MKQPCVYIFCGYSFAGKTTLAKVLEQRLGIACIDLDQINTQRGVGLDGGPIAPEEFAQTEAEGNRLLAERLRAGQSVLFDAANVTRAKRDELRAIAARSGAESCVISVALSEAEARQRWQRNRLTGERYDVRDEDFEYLVAHFEAPTEEEHVLLYHPSHPLEAWIKQHFPLS